MIEEQYFDKAPDSNVSNVSNTGSVENYCAKCRKDHDGQWIQCDKCEVWLHSQCVNLNEMEVNAIDKYFCKTCEQAGFGSTTRKQPHNSHRYDPLVDDEDMKLKTQVGTPKFIEDLKRTKFDDFACIQMNGEDLTMKYLKMNGFYRPILVSKPNNLDMSLPENFSHQMLLDALGSNHKLEVINVHFQSLENLTLAEFVSLFEHQNRAKTYNCISLELSQTELSERIQPPKIVRKMSWADRVFEKPDRPAVSKYCLLSMKDSYTDFHIDFSGTSVWYHVVRGLKRFFFIKPTDENIDKYENWQRTDDNNEYFLPDIVGRDQCFEFTLEPGNTMFIPAGWIHAVHTPSDSVVFGGNYLQTWGAHLQIRVFEGELRCGFLDKFKFPCFKVTHWCATAFVYKFLKNLCDRGLINKKSIAENSVHQKLFKSFESFREFTCKFHEEIEQIQEKLQKCADKEKEAKAILGDEYRDLEEFEAIFNTYESHNYTTSLRNMKEYLDKIRPDSETILATKNDDKITTVLNNLELPQKSVNLSRKKDEERDLPSFKRMKSDHQNGKNDSSNGKLKEEKSQMRVAKDLYNDHHLDRRKDHYSKETITQFKDLPISHTLHLISPNKHKNAKHLYNTQKSSPLTPAKPIFIPSNLLEANSLKNFRIPKKSRSQELPETKSTDIDNHIRSSSLPDTKSFSEQSINSTRYSNQPIEDDDWID